MQAAGSDQWGNITTGVELINKMLGKEAYAFTMPIITDSTGKKMGKSEGNALWLDKTKTTPYAIYQYMFNTTDDIVENYLKIFTFLTKEEIEDVMKKQNEKPEDRIAQKTLAYEFVKDLHGEEEAKKAIEISEALFTDKIKTLDAKTLKENFKDVPSFEVSEDKNIVDFVVDNNICTSKREAREMISGNAISINNEKVTDLEYTVSKKDAIDNEVIIVKKGKKKYYLGIYR